MSQSIRSQVAELTAAGLTAPEIARRLGVAPATVGYHLGRLFSDPSRRTEPAVSVDNRTAVDVPGSDAVTRSPGAENGPRTRDAVARLLASGVTRAQAARILGVTKATVSYHARRLDMGIDDRFARRYDWAEVQRYYDVGHSVRDCIGRFGFSSASWFQAVKRGEVLARPIAIPIDALLAAGTYRGRFHLKLRLIREGLKEQRCERCGISEWHGEPITLALHHLNGVRDDNTLENLQLLCPNCHSQTDTFAGRNGSRGRITAQRGEPPDRPTPPS